MDAEEPPEVAAELARIRLRQDDSGNKRQTVEIQVTHVGPDLQFQSATVGPAAPTPAEEEQTA